MSNTQEVTDRFAIYNDDCIKIVGDLPDASVDYSIFSPPFASLYTYSNSPRDMGNARRYEEFFDHFAFLTKELFRVLKDDCLISFHCMQIPTSKERDGYSGLRDFRGDLIRAFQSVGFIYHSEVCIWKNPVVAMQRTHAPGLLYHRFQSNSSVSRQGLPDYLVTVRKPGVRAAPIRKDRKKWPDADSGDRSGVERWQRYASPIWVTEGATVAGFRDCSATPVAGDDSSGIDPGDTLQHRSVKEEQDEKHISPLQLPVIERALEIWSAKKEVVLSPFMGIGSEGYVALRKGRRFIGAELKTSYYKQSVENLRSASKEKKELKFA